MCSNILKIDVVLRCPVFCVVASQIKPHLAIVKWKIKFLWKKVRYSLSHFIFPCQYAPICTIGMHYHERGHGIGYQLGDLA
jgi:hypothetical protein